MTFDSLYALALVGLVIGTGAPAAIFLTRDRGRVPAAEVAAVAGTVGVLVQVTVGIALDRLWVYRIDTWAPAVAVVVVATAVAAWRVRHRVRPPAVDVTSAVLLLATVAAVFVAGATSYFVFQTGDMGSYVNAANILADGDGLGSGFPHGFIVWLADAHLVAGEALMVQAAVPSLGALFLLTASSVTRGLTGSGAAAVVVAALILIHPTARWFASIPVSEALFVVVLAGTLVVLLGARAAGDVVGAVVAGSGVAMLLVIRANALVMAFVLVVAALVSMVVDRRHTATAHAAFTTSAVFGLVSAYAYNVRYLRAYFVEAQLEVELPPRIFDALDRLDLLSVSPSLVVLGLVVTAVAAGLTLAVRPSATAVRDRRRRWAVPVVTVLAVAVTGSVAAMLGTESLVDALERWHVLLLGLAVAGAVVLAVGRLAEDPVVLAMVLTTGGFGIVLFAVRLDETLEHAYYLYWDRYLFGDAFFVALVLAGCVAAGATAVVRRLDGWRAWAASGVFAVAAIAAGVSTVPPVVEESVEISQHRLLGNSYAALDAIAEVVAHDGSEPVVFSGPPTPPTGWFFPNTFRAYGVPLSQTFGVRVVNLPVEAFAADPVVRSPEARRRIIAAARDSDAVTDIEVDAGYLLRVRPAVTDPAAGEPVPIGPGAELVRTVWHRVWLLPRLFDPDDEEFVPVDVVLELYRIDVS